MQKKTSARRNHSAADMDIQRRSMEAVPRWALALCAVMLVLSFAIRQIGLDISSPINRIMSAHAVRIESQSATGQTSTPEEMQALRKELNALQKRVKKLEVWSHKPAHKH
ncbi:hypothetical protein [Enterovibrio coralii]|uniref:Uncharacterized protein n=1 Tax=Enterovibrio coralii TaxID=294935 RepID=A0A135IA93_9GAMM|nr:hypothetical protein [Enterovibrio coralii]KXF82318.1 hypothetical protein ATN88_09135 [Enterovibrio coralii]